MPTAAAPPGKLSFQVKPFVVIGALLATLAFGVWVGRSPPGLPDVGADAVPIAAVDDRELVGPCAVTRFVDGETVDVTCGVFGDTVRLLNIDTPERGEVGFHAAMAALRQMVGGRSVFLVYEFSYRPSRGRSDRLLAYLYADDVNLNLEMVRAGWTPYYTESGTGRFPDEFMQAEAEAMRGRRGLWSVQ